jgi:hypothetical protein
VSVAQLRDPKWTGQWGTSASIMSYARFNYVAQPGDKVDLIPKFGPYDYFAIDWGYRQYDEEQTCDSEWPVLDALAAKQTEDPSIRFGGEDTSAEVDSTISSNVLSNDPIESTELGLRNIERIARLLVPATTRKGEGYSILGEKYAALVMQRHRELTYVAKLVGGVEETRYQAGRGGPPYQPVPPERQRQAVRFLVEHGFAAPAALADPDLLRRITPSGGSAALKGSSTDLLRKLVDPDVFQRMAEANIGAQNKYAGVDMLYDLNDGLFSELDAGAPQISLYRRDLQRNYLTVLLAATGAINDPAGASRSIDYDAVYADSGSMTPKQKARVKPGRDFYSPLAEVDEQYRGGRGRPSEFRSSLRAAVAHLYKKIEAGLEKVEDAETAMHLREMRAELSQVP